MTDESRLSERRLPGTDYLGRASAAAAMLLVLHDLERMEGFDRLPLSIGPRAVLGDILPIPTIVSHPGEWVRQVLAGCSGRVV